jgi:hypothetical protein
MQPLHSSARKALASEERLQPDFGELRAAYLREVRLNAFLGPWLRIDPFDYQLHNSLLGGF